MREGSILHRSVDVMPPNNFIPNIVPSTLISVFTVDNKSTVCGLMNNVPDFRSSNLQKLSARSRTSQKG